MVKSIKILKTGPYAAGVVVDFYTPDIIIKL
jgi:hypothetical protein